MLMCGAILFSVQTRLSSPEIVVYPHASELFKLMTKVVRDIIEGYVKVIALIKSYNSMKLSLNNYFIHYRSKRFARWLDGTCIEVEPINLPDRDEPIAFTFFTDISYHSDILDQATVLQETVRSGISSLLKQAHWWKKYRGLWKVQKVSQSMVLLWVVILPNDFYFV